MLEYSDKSPEEQKLPGKLLFHWWEYEQMMPGEIDMHQGYRVIQPEVIKRILCPILKSANRYVPDLEELREFANYLSMKLEEPYLQLLIQASDSRLTTDEVDERATIPKVYHHIPDFLRIPKNQLLTEQAPTPHLEVHEDVVRAILWAIDPEKGTTKIRGKARDFALYVQQFLDKSEIDALKRIGQKIGIK